MRFPLSTKTDQALTLIECLVIIAIIVLLIGLLGLITSPPGRPSRSRCLFEEAAIREAVQRYYTTYQRFPVANGVKSQMELSGDDITFGGVELNAVLKSGGMVSLNSELMAILMDIESFPNGQPTVNGNHLRNPQRIKFLVTKIVGDTNSGGVGSDLVFRDPWGHPYIVSIDLNGDSKTRDIFTGIAQCRRTEGTRAISA